jgi:hypothetical protein
MGYAGSSLTDGEWQAAGGRSKLWDWREQCKRIRMGAPALVRAREALRPCGLFVSFHPGRWGFLSKIYQVRAGFFSGLAGASVSSIVRSLAQYRDLQQRLRRVF